MGNARSSVGEDGEGREGGKERVRCTLHECSSVLRSRSYSVVSVLISLPTDGCLVQNCTPIPLC